MSAEDDAEENEEPEEVDSLTDLLADWEGREEPASGPDRLRIDDLLGAIPEDYFEAVRERAAEVLHVEPDSLDDRRETDDGTEDAAEDLDELLDEYDDEDDREGDEWYAARRDIGRLLAEVDRETFGAMKERAAEVLGCEPWAVEKHRYRRRYRDEYGPVVVEDGRTWRLGGGIPLRRHQILNFELRIDGLLQMNGEEWVDASKRLNGSVSQGQFQPRDLKKKQRFEDNVLGTRFGLNFEVPDALGMHPSDLLNEINGWIDQQDVPVRQGTHHVGLHGDEMVFPEGTLGPEGWKDDPDTVHVNRDVAFERGISIGPGVDEIDTDDVAEILRTLPSTRDPERFLAVLGWFYAAPIRPLIFDDWNAGQFNHLNVTGDTGSGKTHSIRYLWRCFGVNLDPLGVRDSAFSRLTSLAGSNGVPVWFDEYKPADVSERKLQNFHDDYRKAATGQVVPKGRADQTTDEYHFQAPVVLSGEEQVRPPAERRRSIMVQFRKDVTDDGTETARAFKELTGEGWLEDGELQIPDGAPEPEAHALAYYRWLAGVDEADLRAKWQDARELVWEYRQQWPFDLDIGDLESQGFRTVVFGWMAMRAFAEEYGVGREELPDEDDLNATLRHVAQEIGPEGKRKTHLDRFVELLSRAASAGFLEENVHYAVVHEGGPQEELRVKVPMAFDAVSKYVRDHDLDTEDLLSGPEDYQHRIKEAADTEGGYVWTESQNPPPLARCAGFSTIRAMTEVDFNRRNFGLKPMDSPDGEDDDSDGDDGDDGGNGSDSDIEDARGRIAEHIRSSRGEGETLNPDKLSLDLDIPPSKVDHALRTLKEQGVVQELARGDFEVLKGGA